MEFKVLGSLRAECEGIDRAPSAPKQRQVLAVLLMHAGKAVRVQDLIDELWEDQAPGTAVGVVRTYVHRLRRSLAAGGLDGDRLVGGRSGYLLRIAPESLDLTSFRRLSAEGRRELDAGRPRVAARLLREALSLWSEPALVDVPKGPLLRSIVADLDELRRNVLEARVRADLALDVHREDAGEVRDGSGRGAVGPPDAGSGPAASVVPAAGRRATMEDVGRLAGVGRGSVSRVLGGSATVSERTREAVLDAARVLGYAPNEAARSLAGRRAGTVALVLSEEPGSPFEQPYFGRIIRGISTAASEAGMNLTLEVTRSARGRGALADRLSARRVDGVLLISLLTGDPLADLLERRGIPVVLGGRAAGRSYVDADNRGGSRRAAGHLIDQGRRHVASIAGPPRSPAGSDRLAGYRQALGDRPELVCFGDFSEPGGALAMRGLLAERPDVDAVFAASDNMALGALRVLEAAGRRVPDDVAVVGFEDSVLGLPALTTVHQPTLTMGERMVEMLLSRIGGARDAPDEVICDTRLVLRRSA